MTILENSSTKELIDLDNLLYNDFNTYQYWFDAFKDEDKIRIELIESINEKLKANNYDGPNDYYAMHWFAKGLNLPVPQKPKRYVDSDDYLFNNLHELKHYDKLNDFKRERLASGQHYRIYIKGYLSSICQDKNIRRKKEKLLTILYESNFLKTFTIFF